MLHMLTQKKRSSPWKQQGRANSRQHCQPCVHEQLLCDHQLLLLLCNLCPFSDKTKVNPAAASTWHLMNIFFFFIINLYFLPPRYVTWFIQGCNLSAALLPDEWTARSHAQLAHKQSRSLRARHHWLRTRACHREERRSSKQLLNGPVNYLSRPVSLCDHSVYRSADWLAFFPSSLLPGALHGAETWTRAREQRSTVGATPPIR